ncbi:porin [soil metagenome]
MKKLFAISALAVLAPAFAPAAYAQSSVTVYGIVDLGVSMDDRGNGVGRSYEVKNGFMSGSRLGFRGQEDLGNGWKALFNIEQAISADNGTITSYAGQPGSTATGVGWNRKSVVGLSGPWGMVTLGRDYTPFFYSSLNTDNLALGLYGSNLNQVAMNAGVSENFHRASNGVFYETLPIAGLTLRAFGTAGAETPDGNQRMLGLGGDYRLGGLLASVGYQTNKIVAPTAAATGKRKDFVGGAKYRFGDFSVGAGYARVDPPGGNNDITSAWFGGAYYTGPHTVLAQVGQMKFDAPTAAGEGKGKSFGVAYTYGFSKQTTAYVTYGRVSNTGTSRLNLYAAAASVTANGAGADPTGLGVGIRKTF